MFTHVYLISYNMLPMCTYVSSCLPMYTNVYHIYPCLPMFAQPYPYACLLMFTHVCPYIPMFTSNAPILVFTNQSDTDTF